MAPNEKRSIKNDTLHYALEHCKKDLLMSVISNTDIEIEDAMEVMRLIKKSEDINNMCMTPLQGAVFLGHVEMCKQLVVEGATLESSCDSIPHPLSLALSRGLNEIAELLIDFGADVNLSFSKKLPLAYALKNELCPLTVVKRIIDAGFPYNDPICLESNRTALHAAVEKHETNIIKYLISLGVDTNKVDNKGLSPLHSAVQMNHGNIVKLLLKNGARINIECSGGFTPMFYSIAMGNCEMVKLLLTHGADIHYESCNTTGSLMPLNLAAILCKLKIVQLLLEKGVDVNRPTSQTGEIALHSAARADIQNSQPNRVSLNCIVQLLIKAGSNLDAIHKFGCTPLQMAINTGNFSVAKILIRNGANLNTKIKDNDGHYQSILHLVAKTLNLDVITLCLEYGADYLAKDSSGLNPCQVALMSTFIKTHSLYSERGQLRLNAVELFWRYGVPFDSTFDIECIKQGNLSRVGGLFHKQKMLLNGIKGHNLKLVQKALELGADVHFVTKELKTPVHFIASKGDGQILKEFLIRGAHANSFNNKGETALHIAARAGHAHCCRLLLEHGAVYNYRSEKSKKTPLELAEANGHTEVVYILSTIDEHFREIKKGTMKKIKQDMKIFVSVMNCMHRDGNTLLGRACKFNNPCARRLMKIRLEKL